MRPNHPVKAAQCASYDDRFDFIPPFLTGLVNRVNFVLQLLGYYHYYMYGGDEHNTELSMGLFSISLRLLRFPPAATDPTGPPMGPREASAHTETHTFRNHAPAMPCVCVCAAAAILIFYSKFLLWVVF